MRIAIYENLPPGGAKRAAYELGRYLAGRHEVDLYQLSVTDNRVFDLRPRVKQVYVYPFHPLRGILNTRLEAGHLAPRSYTLFWPLRALHRRIAADLSGRGYDVVLAHTDAMTQSPYLLRWLPRVPTVYFCQEVFRVAYEAGARRVHRDALKASRFPLGILRVMEDAAVRPRLAANDRRNAQAAGAVVVNSRYSRERVLAAYGRDALVCYLGVDTDVFRPRQEPEPAPAKGERFVLSVGGPARAKGHATVIEALSLLPSTSRPMLSVVMPALRDARLLERHAREREVRLRIETGISDEQLAERYRGALATTCAARLEPFGFTPLESMACGTPVVAIDEGGYRETVRPGVTGLLVDPIPQAIADGIASLVKAPGEAARMGACGRAWVEAEWTWPRSGAGLEAILERAVRADRAPA